jgi:regulator of RNase E activity RraA
MTGDDHDADPSSDAADDRNGDDNGDGTDLGTLCDRYAQLYTGLVTDALDELGYHDRTLDPTVGPLTPGTSTAGIAYPAVGDTDHRVDPEAQMRRFLTMLGDVPEHGVLTIAANGDASAQVGELTTTALAEQGARGVVVDGGTRDCPAIVDQGFPTFTRYRTPADSIQRWQLREWGEPAFVGGVRVEPGDVVVGDADGVAVVPREVREEVLDRAEAMAADEDAVRAAILEGATPLEAYERHGTF